MPRKPERETVFTIEGDAAVLLVLEIDWAKRQVTMHGAGGWRGGELTREEYTALFERETKDITFDTYVVWPENADGRVQVESRDPTDIYNMLNGTEN